MLQKNLDPVDRTVGVALRGHPNDRARCLGRATGATECRPYNSIHGIKFFATTGTPQALTNQFHLESISKLAAFSWKNLLFESVFQLWGLF